MLGITALAAMPASADTDYSDIWYEGAAAGGWGVTFSQNDNAIFTTFFVYDSSGKPTWFGGTMYRSTNGNYAGALYTTTGDYFGDIPYNPGSFSALPAGTMSFSATDVSHGLLSYTVNGVVVNKTIQRQLLVPLNLAGTYTGAEQFSLTGSGCGSAATPQSFFDQYVVQQTAVASNPANSNIVIAFYDGGTGEAACSIQGLGTQTGKVIDIPNATSTCPSGSGSIATHVYDMRLAADAGMEFRWTTPNLISNCTLTGRVNALNALKTN